jgi:tRNA pseudouridine32 synthase/23S rRNA pseudouridine746 synthase
VEAIAHQLMQTLKADPRFNTEGKMYGVLLAESAGGERVVLKAFSGLLQGEAVLPGWVPPIPGRERVALAEAGTLARLEAMKQELLTLAALPERQEYTQQAETFAVQLQDMRDRHHQRKHQRHRQRQLLAAQLTGEALADALAALEIESQQDGIERRKLKRQRDAVLAPLKQVIDQADQRMQELKRERKALSRELQAQLHASYWLENFAGERRSLPALMPKGMPTGTGDCCAPKLLHYAAAQGLRPQAMAEFWWGPPPTDGSKQPGKFYGACAERCQPLMGFLLSGLKRSPAPGLASDLSLDILYEDDWLIAVDKPAGLLSMPGRYRHNQDSVLSRLRCQILDGESLRAVHRLDRDTSGILLVVRHRDAQRQLSQQFQSRQVHKVYEALLAGIVLNESGEIHLPLGCDPAQRPRRVVDYQRGKFSMTQFRRIAWEGDCTRMELVPITGRTHQLRVHAAHPDGLGVPILGDRLYSKTPEVATTKRLHLHARAIHFTHPKTGQPIALQSTVPF